MIGKRNLEASVETFFEIGRALRENHFVRFDLFVANANSDIGESMRLEEPERVLLAVTRGV